MKRQYQFTQLNRAVANSSNERTGGSLSIKRSDNDVCQRPCIISKPWGHEELWAHTSQYAGKILFIKKGHRLSLQYHQVKDETIRVLSGQFELELGEGIKMRMHAGDVQHIPHGMHHRMNAISDCRILEVSTTELNDVVRLKDDYGRK